MIVYDSPFPFLFKKLVVLLSVRRKVFPWSKHVLLGNADEGREDVTQEEITPLPDEESKSQKKGMEKRRTRS